MDARSEDSEFEFGPELHPPVEQQCTTPSVNCWICRRPIVHERSVRYRGEPVHPDCLPR